MKPHHKGQYATASQRQLHLGFNYPAAFPALRIEWQHLRSVEAWEGSERSVAGPRRRVPSRVKGYRSRETCNLSSALHPSYSNLRARRPLRCYLLGRFGRFRSCWRRG